VLEWEKLGERHTKPGYRALIFKRYRLPDGSEREFTTFGDRGDRSVGIIALTADGQIIVARQFRPGPEMVLEELPGGDVEPGESLEAAARRELREETGYISDEFEYLGALYREAYTNATAHYFMAYNCRLDGPQMLDPGEFVTVDLVSPKQFIENARTKKMGDVGAVFFAYERLMDMVQSTP
jgi:ADP-ribose pyrophosphatase